MLQEMAFPIGGMQKDPENSIGWMGAVIALLVSDSIEMEFRDSRRLGLARTAK